MFLLLTIEHGGWSEWSEWTDSDEEKCTTNSCYNSHVSKMIISEEKDVTGWNIDVSSGKWQYPASSNVYEQCGNGHAWYGWSGGANVGSISTILKGNGRAKLNFGNCWNTGIVKVYLDDIEIGSADNNVPSKDIEFDFQQGNVLKLRDEGPNSVIQLNSLEVIECKGSTFICN